MVYIVGLVEYCKITHKWIYEDYMDAISQLRSLLNVFDEVNEVRPVLLKVAHSEQNIPLDTLLKQYSFTPKSSDHE